jgi:hypothetical protein
MPESPGGTIHATGSRWLAAHLRSRFGPVLVILSPPRSGSTVVARSFWRNPRFGWYVHEPYDRVYHRDGGRDSIRRAVSDALETPEGRTAATGVIIKEMTFQAGPLTPELITAATLPVLVTVRDPRLATWSRMRQRAKSGQEPCFPHIETGWPDLEDALAFMRERDVPYVIVDVTELRRRPAAHLTALCERLGLPFTRDMLSWPKADDVSFGRLDGEQNRWYSRVLSSTGFQRPTEKVPRLDAFPAENGMRAHVADCLDAYQAVLDDPHLLVPDREPQR